MPGYSCSDTVGQSSTNVFKDNVAHSVDGSGALIYPDKTVATSQTCYQGSHFAAYKNKQAGIATHYSPMEIRMSNMVMIDNKLGVSLQGGGETDKERKLVFKDSFVYGEGDDIPSDCPEGADGSADCFCPTKYGIMSFGSNHGTKSLHIPDASPRPIYKIKSYAAWNTKITIDDVEVINFQPTTACAGKQTVFQLNPSASDYIPIHYITRMHFTNVAYNALAFIYDPPAGWANVTDCGDFPCTAPYNLILNFNAAEFAVTDGTTALPSFWTEGSTNNYKFQIVADAPNVVEHYTTECTKNEEWNAWFCPPTTQSSKPQIDMLQFESLDKDTEDRSVQPVIITNDDGYENKLNSMMDHEWDGFYTGQHRLSRFNAQIEAGKHYTITYTGTPPNKMRYWLIGDEGTKGITLKVPYPNAGSYSVKVNGKIVEPEGFDSETSKPKLINPDTATCGVNRYVGIENYLEFFVTPGCIVNIVPRDAILTSVRLNWTAAEFFAGDGATTFMQRMASALGVHISRVKIVAVYEGSVTVET